ncbi:MAG: DUF805 domain-containing protein [Sphingomonadaceae bacterium]|nr:DUF805 domain-containing protein [Sphingomonadaceae bacterium]
MLQWAILPFKRYFDFKGRSRRKEYWSFALLNVIIIVLLMAILFGTGASMGALSDMEGGDPSAFASIFAGGFGIVIGLYWLGILIPSISVVVRRLHDRDMSGWWYLGLVVGSLIPIVNFIAGIAFLVLMFLPGTPGPNRFGPDPKDPASVDVFS